MGKRASKTLVGAFVLGAVALAVVAVIVLGLGRIFRHPFVNVMYFQGSVKGLSVGSPVMFRGVRIGSVKKIELRYDGRDLSFLVPVYVEIDPATMVYVGHKPGQQHTRELINKGLRAQLQMQSFVTGQLMVDLDFFGREKPAVLFGLDKRYDEIPTIPAEFEELSKKVEDLPIRELFDKLLSVSSGLDRLVNSPDTQTTVQTIKETAKELKKTIAAINAQIAPVMGNIRDSSEAFRSITRNVDAALAGDNGIPVQISQTLKAAQDALRQADKALSSVDALVADKASVLDSADASLEEITNAARSFRILTDLLERHPEALIRGKKP